VENAITLTDDGGAAHSDDKATAVHVSCIAIGQLSADRPTVV